MIADLLKTILLIVIEGLFAGTIVSVIWLAKQQDGRDILINIVNSVLGALLGAATYVAYAYFTHNQNNLLLAGFGLIGSLFLLFIMSALEPTPQPKKRVR